MILGYKHSNLQIFRMKPKFTRFLIRACLTKNLYQLFFHLKKREDKLNIDKCTSSLTETVKNLTYETVNKSLTEKNVTFFCKL